MIFGTLAILPSCSTAALLPGAEGGLGPVMGGAGPLEREKVGNGCPSNPNLLNIHPSHTLLHDGASTGHYIHAATSTSISTAKNISARVASYNICETIPSTGLSHRTNAVYR